VWGSPVPPYPAGVWLRVSFDIMLKLAGALDQVDTQAAGEGNGGIYFRGASSILYPTAHFAESNTVQWRLVSNVEITKLKPDWSPNDIPGNNWTRIDPESGDAALSNNGPRLPLRSRHHSGDKLECQPRRFHYPMSSTLPCEAGRPHVPRTTKHPTLS